MVFLALGDVVTAALYQTGEFTRDMALYVWAILAGLGRRAPPLDARPALRLDLLRPARHPDTAPVRRAARGDLGLALGYLFAVRLPPLLGLERRWGAAGLTLASALAGTLEYLLLRRTLRAPDRRHRTAAGGYLAPCLERGAARRRGGLGAARARSRASTR